MAPAGMCVHAEHPCSGAYGENAFSSLRGAGGLGVKMVPLGSRWLWFVQGASQEGPG